MAATPAKSGPTRRRGSLAIPCRALPTMGVVAAAGWMGVSLVFLASSRFSNSGAGLPASISTPLFGHLFLFGMLGFLTAVGALVIKRSERLGVALVAALLVGGAWALATEWYQTTLPGRDASLEDLLVNALGTAAGAWLAWVARHRIARLRRFLCTSHSGGQQAQNATCYLTPPASTARQRPLRGAGNTRSALSRSQFRQRS